MAPRQNQCQIILVTHNISAFTAKQSKYLNSASAEYSLDCEITFKKYFTMQVNIWLARNSKNPTEWVTVHKRLQCKAGIIVSWEQPLLNYMISPIPRVIFKRLTYIFFTLISDCTFGASHTKKSGECVTLVHYAEKCWIIFTLQELQWGA